MTFDRQALCAPDLGLDCVKWSTGFALERQAGLKVRGLLQSLYMFQKVTALLHFSKSSEQV